MERRVFQIASELNIPQSDIINLLQSKGMDIGITHTIDEDIYQLIKKTFNAFKDLLSQGVLSTDNLK